MLTRQLYAKMKREPDCRETPHFVLLAAAGVSEYRICHSGAFDFLITTSAQRTSIRCVKICAIVNPDRCPGTCGLQGGDWIVEICRSTATNRISPTRRGRSCCSVSQPATKPASPVVAYMGFHQGWPSNKSKKKGMLSPAWILDIIVPWLPLGAYPV